MQIQKIVATIGEMVEVDDDIEEALRLDRAQVLIKTPWRPPIQHTINVVIDGEACRVYIAEDNGTSTGKCNCRLRSVFGSSEEIESEKSEVGTPRSKEDAPSENEVALRRTSCNPNDGFSGQGNTLMSSGQNEPERPQCKNRVLWKHCPTHNGCRAESIGGKETKHMACPKMAVDDRPQEEEANMTESEQCERQINMTGREQCFHESENVDLEVGHKLSGKQNLNEKGHVTHRRLMGSSEIYWALLFTPIV